MAKSYSKNKIEGIPKLWNIKLKDRRDIWNCLLSVSRNQKRNLLTRNEGWRGAHWHAAEAVIVGVDETIQRKFTFPP